MTGGVFTDTVGNKTYQFTRSSSIPGDLNNGYADIGFVGSDKIDEAQLGGRWTNIAGGAIAYAGCSLVLAAKEPLCNLRSFRIATSYPNLTSRWLQETFQTFRRDSQIVLTTAGATEGYYGVNDANTIVDIRESGQSLLDNNFLGPGIPIQSLETKMIWREGKQELELDVSSLCGALMRIKARKASSAGASTTALLLRDRNEQVKKLGSEMAEFIADLVSPNDEGLTGEAQDVIYSLAVALESRGQSLIDALNRL